MGKFILRRLMRSPMFAAITLLTLAIGIGANTAIFSVINGVLLKPLPYNDPDRLVGLWHTAPGLNLPEVNMAPANYFPYREQGRAFEDVGLYTGGSVSVMEVGQPEWVETLWVTDGTLPILGVRPELGRFFTRLDDTDGSPRTAVLTWGYWQQRFGGSPAAVGKTIVVDGRQHEIIGVLPRSFQFMDREVSLAILQETSR